jgi:hypothetical protein
VSNQELPCALFKLCEHLKDIASVGYGYTRTEGVNLASDYALFLAKMVSQ